MRSPADGIWTAAKFATVLSIEVVLFLDRPVKVLFTGMGSTWIGDGRAGMTAWLYTFYACLEHETRAEYRLVQ